jgi:hypothetical protein
MSSGSSTLTSIPIRQDEERSHRFRVYIAAAVSAAFLTVLTVYGADYYTLNVADRPFSPKYELLRPSGTIGIKLGILGVALFCIIFLYALRKRIPWLARMGSSRHWMEFHIVAGVTAPVVIAFHASFKFRGIAGVAFWIMLAVAISGIIGRYLYAQIPRSMNAAEISLKELRESEENIARTLSGQNLFSAEELDRLLHVPPLERVQKMTPALALLLMIALDLRRPFQVARLRRRATGWEGGIRSFGGLLRTGSVEVEGVIDAARRKSALSKRIVFLGRTHQVFHLWHVIHRPFSYTFAVLAIVHIVVAVGLGFL